MPFDPDDDGRRPAPVVHQIGQDLSALSLTELESRITLLKEEIARLEAEIAAKSRHRSAADRVFGSR